MTLASATEKPPPLRLPPLTRNDYRRSAEVEGQIRAALTLSRPLLRQRVAIRDSDASDFLQEEALVFLIRHYHAGDESDHVGDLCEALVSRITGSVKKWLKSYGLHEGTDRFNDAFRDVITGVLAGVRPEGRGKPSGGLLDLSSDKADFFQVRFWPALHRLSYTVLRHSKRMKKRDHRSVELNDVAGHGIGDGDEGTLVPLDEWETLSAEPYPETYLLRQFGEDQLSEALAAVNVLPNATHRPLRDVFVLRHCEGWQIESEDPEKVTLSNYYGKPAKTIYNWLKKAEKLLAENPNL
ncbi:MAG: hypothetical protein ABJF88_14275 [Rhodothermales bacterium]